MLEAIKGALESLVFCSSSSTSLVPENPINGIHATCFFQLISSPPVHHQDQKWESNYFERERVGYEIKWRESLIGRWEEREGWKRELN